MAQQTETQERTDGRGHDHRTAKVIEIVGTSRNSFGEAIEHALADARSTTRGISGAEVQNMSLRCENGRIEEYKVDLKVAFGIEHAEEP